MDCAIIAQDSIPRRSGDRIKTDRRDALKLAEYFAANLLPECFVQEKEMQSVRSRVSLIKTLHQSKMRVIQFLHTRGHIYTAGGYSG